MAKKQGSRSVSRPQWMRYRFLLAVEALLLVDVLLRAFEQALVASELPGWAIVLAALLVVIAALGGLLLVIERLAKRSVNTVHKVAKGLPLPIPMLLVHIAFFAGCAWVVAWDLDVLQRLWD